MFHTPFIYFFFFNDTATTEIYTLSLHDALPISAGIRDGSGGAIQIIDVGRTFGDADNGSLFDENFTERVVGPGSGATTRSVKFSSKRDRKSTRLNSSHTVISYAVFCLKKKMKYIPCTEHEYHRARIADNRFHDRRDKSDPSTTQIIAVCTSHTPSDRVDSIQRR